MHLEHPTLKYTELPGGTNSFHSLVYSSPVLIVLMSCVLFAAAVTLLLYHHIKTLLEAVLREELAVVQDISEIVLAPEQVDQVVRGTDSVVTNAMLVPFALFVAILVLLLVLLVLVIVRLQDDRMQAVQEIDREKDELLSIVSHQLATPVSSVKFALEMLQDGDYGELNEEQSQQVSKLLRTVLDLIDLVNMILDVSRIDMQRMKPGRTILNLNDFFDQIIDVITTQAEEKEVDFRVNIPVSLPVAKLDRRLMRMAVENFLSNAVKYTPSGGNVSFRVWVNEGTLHYEVKDTGCGIPLHDQHLVFTKLFRASNVGEANGNGFGLYAAKGAIESHGGTVHFTSREGKGTSFWVRVPLEGS